MRNDDTVATMLLVNNAMLLSNLFSSCIIPQQCWTEGRSSTAVAEDFRPTATATVAEV